MLLTQPCIACGEEISMVLFERKDYIVCPHCFNEVPAEFDYVSDEDFEDALKALEE